MKHFLLTYTLAPDYMERRPAFRAEHLALAKAAAARGELLLGGAVAGVDGEAPDEAQLLFAGADAEAAEAFARADPYVTKGLVSLWRVRQWVTVVGEGAAQPVQLEMCNLYRMEKAPDAIVGLIRELGTAVGFPEGVPNFQPREVRICDRAPILRAASTGEGVELVERRWSWPGPSGKPVFNFRGEGRRFAPDERCVVIADGFYEFTAPADPKAKKKDRWLFEWPGHQWFGIAGIVRNDPAVGEAFTLLTSPPGGDVAPYHNRQIVLLSPRDCLAWLDPAREAADFTGPLPEGTLSVKRA